MPNLVEVIKRVALEAVNASNPTSLVVGMVTNTNPLQVTVEQKLTLDEDFLILTKHVQDHYVDMSVSHYTEQQGFSGLAHSHTYSGITNPTDVDQHKHLVSIPSQETEPSMRQDTPSSQIETSTVKNSSTSHEHNYSGVTEDALKDEELEVKTKHLHRYEGRKKILLHYGLKQGETVLLIKMQGGQKYIVLDRLGEVPTEGEWV